ncbi:hypothetical protein QV09_05505 [Gallibacterium salpingitidis]|uniref:Uncharacterized protein n=1 Tax=Gallibacterium salpingitidis TaxID=505341 RepID=A0AB36E2K3_9PAST|nr:hypothetical protein [Gallibacterium salpingitidis]OBX10407.1 hypothetical protein QV09_05505 [Gallibacterium salpingitidis]WKT00527.1 hypothetical protein NYR30_04365 [Gallibacterium salpingitidis]
MPYVYSTLTSDNTYVIYADGGADLKIKTHQITIKGGTGIANDRLITPLGVATQVSDDDLALLEKNAVFKTHKEHGFIVVQTSGKEADAEKVASDMETRDESSPITPSHYETGNDDVEVIKPTTNKKR